jgi:hypothetical protein
MRIHPIVGVLYQGRHLDPSSTYEVDEGFGSQLIASGRAHEVAAPAAPTPPEVIETRDPVVATREPRARKHETRGPKPGRHR